MVYITNICKQVNKYPQISGLPNAAPPRVMLDTTIPVFPKGLYFNEEFFSTLAILVLRSNVKSLCDLLLCFDFWDNATKSSNTTLEKNWICKNRKTAPSFEW